MTKQNGFMRFIAVYEQRCQMLVHSFDSQVEASDFLFWGYEDHEFMPRGIYDSLTAQITVYTHAGQSLATINPDSIRMVAELVVVTGLPAKVS